MNIQEKLKQLDLSWAVGKYGDGSWNAAINHAESIALKFLMENVLCKEKNETEEECKKKTKKPTIRKMG